MQFNTSLSLARLLKHNINNRFSIQMSSNAIKYGEISDVATRWR